MKAELHVLQKAQSKVSLYSSRVRTGPAVTRVSAPCPMSHFKQHHRCFYPKCTGVLYAYVKREKKTSVKYPSMGLAFARCFITILSFYTHAYLKRWQLLPSLYRQRSRDPDQLYDFLKVLSLGYARHLKDKVWVF